MRKKIYASKFNLGEMYLQGLYVNKDIEQAVKYFEDILTEEYDDAYYKLAEIYEGKYGEIKDEEKARKYYNKIEIDLCSSFEQKIRDEHLKFITYFNLFKEVEDIGEISMEEKNIIRKTEIGDFQGVHKLIMQVHKLHEYRTNGVGI